VAPPTHGHRIDTASAAILLVDAAVLVGVVAALLFTRPRRRTLDEPAPVPDLPNAP
jgi:hypothetical protein